MREGGRGEGGRGEGGVRERGEGEGREVGREDGWKRRQVSREVKQKMAKDIR